MMKCFLVMEGDLADMNSIAMVGKERSEKVGITYFGLQGHEVAVITTTMESVPDLAAEYEVRDPNEAASCDIVLVNKDCQRSASWWKNLKKRNPSAVPMFLTNSREAADGAYCKRPFSPSFLQAAFKDLVSKNKQTAEQPTQSDK